AEVLVQGGARVRMPLARLRPSAEGAVAEEPAVRVVASARGDVSDQLDVRGMRADEAREGVRTFVDDAALAGLSQLAGGRRRAARGCRSPGRAPRAPPARPSEKARPRPRWSRAGRAARRAVRRG